MAMSPDVQIIVRKLVVTLTPKYTCRSCKKVADGDTVVTELDRIEQLQDIHVSNQNMPVGWSSYYSKFGDYYLCPDCKENSDG